MVHRGYAGSRNVRVKVIPQPVDTDTFGYMGERGSKDHVLVSIGRLSPMKGHRTLIRAMTMLPRGVRAIIAGPPSQQTVEELRDYCGELGVEERVEVTGRVSDVREVISRGTLGVVTSLGSEVVSRAGMEMMASGLPLLAAATNGLLDLVEDGTTGLLHSPGNSGQLAAQAAYLLDNPSLIDRMGRCAHKRMVENYSFSAVGDEWQRVLESLLNGTESVSEGIRSKNPE
jgi:glycosyltransferase involved in cell wall biosynthesis